MSQPSSHPQIGGELPAIRLEYRGMEPPLGGEWCLVCSTLYMGAIYNDEANVEACKRIVEQGLARGMSVVYFDLPVHPFYILRESVTHGFSFYFPYPVPVCWVHLDGKFPDRGGLDIPAKSPLIPGKAYNSYGGKKHD